MATTTAWIRSGAGIISNVPSTPFVRESKTITSTVTKYTAVALVSSYDQGNISVWANGTLLLEGTQQDENDFWAPGGLNLYFNADLLTDDVIHVQHYTTHALSDSSFIQRTATQGNTPTRAFIFSEMNDVKPVLAFYNGILISDGNDYTRTGSNFTLDNNLNVNSGDVLTLIFMVLTMSQTIFQRVNGEMVQLHRQLIFGMQLSIQILLLNNRLLRLLK